MIKFARHRTSDEIRAACQAAGFVLDTTRYDNEGSDYIAFDFVHGETSLDVLYNTCNGRFFGTVVAGQSFTESSVELEGEPWYRALLEFVYLPLPAPAEGGAS